MKELIQFYVFCCFHSCHSCFQFGILNILQLLTESKNFFRKTFDVSFHGFIQMNSNDLS